VRLIQNQPVNTYITNLGQTRRDDQTAEPYRGGSMLSMTSRSTPSRHLGGRVYIHTRPDRGDDDRGPAGKRHGSQVGHIVGRHGLENVKRAQKIGIGAAAASILGAIIGGKAGSSVDLAGNLIAGGCSHEA
jgi:hypothetical protein